MYNDIIIKKFVNMGEYMVGRLELTLDSKEIDYKNSSNLQGVIMENIDNLLVEQRGELLNTLKARFCIS